MVCLTQGPGSHHVARLRNDLLCVESNVKINPTLLHTRRTTIVGKPFQFWHWLAAILVFNAWPLVVMCSVYVSFVYLVIKQILGESWPWWWYTLYWRSCSCVVLLCHSYIMSMCDVFQQWPSPSIDNIWILSEQLCAGLCDTMFTVRSTVT